MGSSLSLAICSRAELSLLVQSVLPKSKPNLPLLPFRVSASCSTQQGLSPPSGGALTLSCSHHITHDSCRAGSFTTALQVVLRALESFLSCLEYMFYRDFRIKHLQLASKGGWVSMTRPSPSSTVFWCWAARVRHHFHFMSPEHLRKLCSQSTQTATSDQIRSSSKNNKRTTMGKSVHWRNFILNTHQVLGWVMRWNGERVILKGGWWIWEGKVLFWISQKKKNLSSKRKKN